MRRAKDIGIGCLFLFASFVSTHCSLCAQAKTPANQHGNAVAHIPFVGCASDGQVGPVDAPPRTSKAMVLPAGAAERLAYYKAKDGVGVLAPRGWHCFGTYGSNGETLYVSAETISTADLFSTDWKGFVGPVIQISSLVGDTSGRFAVARTIARVFPTRKAFVQDVIAEGIEPANSFPFGPYAGDVLNYRSKDIVEFQTPADTEGLGTASRLQKNESPISGVAILFGEEPNLLQLCVRLSPESRDLARFIIRQAEREVADFSAHASGQE